MLFIISIFKIIAIFMTYVIKLMIKLLKKQKIY